MGKKMGRLIIAACIALVLLAAGAAMAEDPATPTDINPTDPPAWEIEGDVLIACRVEDEKITVPDGIRVIGPNAFKGLKTMKNVSLPDTVEKISNGASGYDVIVPSDYMVARLIAEDLLLPIDLEATCEKYGAECYYDNLAPGFRGLYYDTEDHMLTKNDIAFMLSATAFSQLPSSAWKFLIWQGKIDCKTQVSCVGDSPFMAVRRICPPP